MFTTINLSRLLKVTSGSLLLIALVSACAAPAGQSVSGVTFSVPIQVEAFSPKGTLQVLVWNAEQLAAQERQAECVISHDMQSGTDTVLCPEGVQYQEIAPEKFDFPIQAIDQRIQLDQPNREGRRKVSYCIAGFEQRQLQLDIGHGRRNSDVIIDDAGKSGLADHGHGVPHHALSAAAKEVPHALPARSDPTDL